MARLLRAATAEAKVGTTWACRPGSNIVAGATASRAEPSTKDSIATIASMTASSDQETGGLGEIAVVYDRAR
ncbi:hypothetical protein [Alloactinosynnema sp. L-07]|nr:hypothetical protein [Alloactinosynnema sp. L-07]